MKAFFSAIAARRAGGILATVLASLPNEAAAESLTFRYWSGWFAAAICLFALIFGLLIWARKKRRAANELDETRSDLRGGTLKASSVFGGVGGQAVDTGNSSFQSDFSQVSTGSIDTDEVDPIAEADVYMAYGRDGQAEEILKEALAKDDSRDAVRVKLMEIYSQRADTASFEDQADALRTSTHGRGEHWVRAAELGRVLLPGSPRFGEPAPSPAGSVPSELADPLPPGLPSPALDLDFDLSDDTPVEDSMNLSDIDMNLPLLDIVAAHRGTVSQKIESEEQNRMQAEPGRRLIEQRREAQEQRRREEESVRRSAAERPQDDAATRRLIEAEYLARQEAEWRARAKAEAKRTLSEDPAGISPVSGMVTATAVQSAHIPAPITDAVHFTVTAPMTVVAGHVFVMDLWAHVEAARAEVLSQASEALAGRPMRHKSRGAAMVERGRTLAVQISIPDFSFVDDDTILWSGRTGNATFAVPVPHAASIGLHVGTARLAVDGVQISRLHFEIEVGMAEGLAGERAVRERRYRSAFASYASEDRNEVLARIQGMQKLLPDLDVFLDIASIRAGEQWAARLEEEIALRETFFLFWSRAASRSEWVAREWRAALRLKGIGGIDPVPLEPPQSVPPPSELAALHFNEWTLAYRTPIQ